MSKMGRMESDSHADEVTVLRKSGPPIRTVHKESDLVRAANRGDTIETNKKFGAGHNIHQAGGVSAVKLDNETEELHHDRVPLSLGRTIQQARQAKEITQKDLATKINERIQVVQEFENGKALPNAQVLGKMERILGVKLRGKEIGKPLGAAPAKPAAKK
uniref:HTH cro/C1-type domain-containing protein n=1 Tax=Panagrellus redivivus TaxID=6233 RepID=A0A7E4W8Q2_PANRE